MFPNPYYHSYQISNPDLVAKTSKLNQKQYFMLDGLVQPSLVPPFIFQGKSYQLREHHVSIFEEYSNDDVFSPLHYTAKFGNIILHVYLKKDGEYLSCRSCLDSALGEKEMDLSDEDKAALEGIAKNLVNKYARETLIKLSGDLLGNQKECYTTAKKELGRLEDESKSGTGTLKYKTVLDKTIQALEDHEKLVFAPDAESKKDQNPLFSLNQGIKKCLMRYRDATHSTQKKNRPLPEISRDNSDEETKDENTQCVAAQPVLSKEKQPVKQKPSITDQSSKSQKLSALYKSKEQELYKKLSQTKKIDEMFAACKELDKLNTHRIKILIQACIEGDLVIFKQHFDKNLSESLDVSTVTLFLSTCVFNNHLDLFHYIYDQFDNPYIKYGVSHPLNQDGEKVSGAASLLEIAYTKRYLNFFRTLLTEYNYFPDQAAVKDFSVLMRASRFRENEYVSALLEAGANPDLTVCQHLQRTEFCYTPHNEAISEQKSDQVKSSVGLTTALHCAARGGNVEGAKLLLKYGAKSSLEDNSRFTPFHLAVYRSGDCTPSTLDEKLIQVFLDHGHSIDEKIETRTQKMTALIIHCVEQNVDAIRTLIKFHANPCVKHPSLEVNIDGETFHMEMTPLLFILMKENDILLEILLSSDQIKITDLEYTYSRCKAMEIAILTRFINKYALAVYQAQQYSSAASLFEEALASTEDNNMRHGILFNLGTCYSKMQNKNREAIKALEACIAIRQAKMNAEPTLFEKNKWEPLIKRAQDRLAEIISPAQLVSSMGTTGGGIKACR